MNVTTFPQDDGQTRIHVVATPAEYRRAVDEGVRSHLAMEGASIPKDRTPSELLSQAVGKDGDKAAAELEFAVDYLMPRAVDQAHVMPVATPTVRRPDPPQPGQGVAFDVLAYPKPEMELSDYGPVTVEVSEPTVSDEEVDGQIDALLHAYAKHAKDAGGKVPKLTDAWVADTIQDPECNTVADLRQKMRASGLRYKQGKMDEYKTSVAVAELSKRLVGQVPQALVDAMARSMRDELDRRLREQGKTEEDFAREQGMTRDALRQRVEGQAREMLREGFTLDAVYRHEGLSVDKDDLREAIHKIAPGHEDAAEASLAGSGYLFTVRETAQRSKAGAWVLAHAHVNVKARS